METALILIAAGLYTLHLMRLEKRYQDRQRAAKLRREAMSAQARDARIVSEVDRSWRLWERRCNREDQQLSAAMKKAWN